MDPDPNTVESELFYNVNNMGLVFRNTFFRMDPGSNTASVTDIKKDFFFRTTRLNTLLSTNLCNISLILGGRIDNNIHFRLSKIFLGQQLCYVRCLLRNLTGLSNVVKKYTLFLTYFKNVTTCHRMMEESSEAEFEKLLSQLRNATEEQQEPDVVDIEDDEALLDEEDEDVVMLEATPSSAEDPATSERSPTPVTTEKVNVNQSDSERNMNIKTDSDNGSGYQASESGSNYTSMFNYSKYGTRSRIGEGEVYIETEKPGMSSTYYQCKAARAAIRNYPTVDVSIGQGAGVSELCKHSSVGSLDCHGDTEILKTFRGSRITANGVTVNQNISATFDPANLKCVICPNAHYILAKGKEESPPHHHFHRSKFCLHSLRRQKLLGNCQA
jgi:hypothetical protein